VLLLSLGIGQSAMAGPQEFPDYLPDQYRKLFVHFADERSVKERLLNAAGLSSAEYGRGFALIAGISRYPLMKGWAGKLDAAAEDVRKLTSYLQTYEKIDEIVVLRDADVTESNLSFFLQQYFPRRLREFPKSRLLFAYSGHGTTQGDRGYILTSSAKDLTDTFNSIPMGTLRAMFQQDVDAGHQVLALINACYSGDFIKRSFGEVQFVPKHSGAHAIVAGGSNELTWHDGSVGSGSIFFEKFFAALDGRAGRAGIVTVDELAAYLKREVQIATDQRQNPIPGDLSRDGSLGGFFFFNRLPLIDKQMLPKWDTAAGKPFGARTPDSTGEKAISLAAAKSQVQLILRNNASTVERLSGTAEWFLDAKPKGIVGTEIRAEAQFSSAEFGLELASSDGNILELTLKPMSTRSRTFKRLDKVEVSRDGTSFSLVEGGVAPGPPPLLSGQPDKRGLNRQEYFSREEHLLGKCRWLRFYLKFDDETEGEFTIECQPASKIIDQALTLWALVPDLSFDSTLHFPEEGIFEKKPASVLKKKR
jgi:hypothetical protein